MEREKDRNNQLPPTHALTGMQPITWVGALIGNRTHHLSVYKMTLQPTVTYWPGM